VSDLDRIKASLQRFLAPLFTRLDHSALYGASVATQNADGSLELKPSTAKLPSMSQVPIRYGIPGISVKVSPGALVVVGWENADPSLPYAMVVSTAAAVVSISFMGGQQPVARQGDVLSMVFPVGPIPFTGMSALLPVVGVITIPPGPAPGIIVTGNPNVTA